MKFHLVSFFVLSSFFFGCKKNDIIQTPPTNKLVFLTNERTEYSPINKGTSWYRTNIAFDQNYNLQFKKYWAFQTKGDGFEIYDEQPLKFNYDYFFHDLEGYIYTDLTGDGIKDLWAYHLINPWPTNKRGVHLFVELDKGGESPDVQYGLTQVRKPVLADFNNDNKQEVMLFSSGYDANPFPGDSLAFFNVEERKYHYLPHMGYYHGGATGDINNDGLEDIVGYSGGSAVIPVHPVCYLNKGNFQFELSNSIFKNFKNDDNYYTVELFDLNKDDKLDLFLGTRGKLIYINNEGGNFDRAKGIDFKPINALEVMDIDFFDFNKDGIEEVIVLYNKDSYKGFAIRIYTVVSNEIKDITSDLLNISELNFPAVGWIKWLRIFDYDKDGDLDLVGDGLFGEELDGTNGGIIYWENNSGKFNIIRGKRN